MYPAEDCSLISTHCCGISAHSNEFEWPTIRSEHEAWHPGETAHSIDDRSTTRSRLRTVTSHISGSLFDRPFARVKYRRSPKSPDMYWCRATRHERRHHALYH